MPNFAGRVEALVEHLKSEHEGIDAGQWREKERYTETRGGPCYRGLLRAGENETFWDPRVRATHSAITDKTQHAEHVTCVISRRGG